jgi:hypothetical protein
MAITTTMVIDNSANTAVGTVTLNGSTIEQLTFTNSTNIVNLVSHGATDMSVADFGSLLKFYIVFNNAVIASFLPVNLFQYRPFTNIDQQLVDDGVNKLSFTFQYTPTDPLPIFNWVCTYPNSTVHIQKRSPNDNLSYAQFLYFLYQAANFRLFFNNAYGL